MSHIKLLIVTTVPDTFLAILRSQPKYLAQFFNVELATSSVKGIEQIELNERIAVHGIHMERGINPFKDAISVLEMIWLLMRVRPGLIHSYTPKAGLVSMLAAWICRVPVRVHTFTGLIFPTATGLRQRILIWVDRLICWCATTVVPEGLGVERDLRRFMITSKPLEVIGYGNIAGVNIDYFSPEAPDLFDKVKTLQQELGLSSGVFVYCFVGRLNKDKGIAELISAFSRLPSNTLLLVVGGVDNAFPVNPQVLKQLERHPRVRMLGFQGDIRAALVCADVLVLPSYREGFPNVVLQAGAMALPVIATNVNGCNEVIEQGMNGWLVPPKDADNLFIAMSDAMRLPESERIEMGKRARLRVLERFEQIAHWNRMVEFYRKETASETAI